jgi:hypothetical protein
MLSVSEVWLPAENALSRSATASSATSWGETGGVTHDEPSKSGVVWQSVHGHFDILCQEFLEELVEFHSPLLPLEADSARAAVLEPAPAATPLVDSPSARHKVAKKRALVRTSAWLRALEVGRQGCRREKCQEALCSHLLLLLSVVPGSRWTCPGWCARRCCSKSLSGAGGQRASTVRRGHCRLV